MFDKETYWKNRKARKRGQGEQPNLIVGVVDTGSQLLGVNRARYRERVNATKHAKFNTHIWTETREVIAKRVANREAVSMVKAAERRERLKGGVK